jgi:hypothetical protein
MKTVNYLSVFIILFAFGCRNDAISPIKFKRTNKTYDIAIEGGLNTSQTLQFIKLSKPAIFPDGQVEPISQATVSINDGNNEVFLSETSTPGIYSGDIINNTNYDQPYTLNVNYNAIDYIAMDTLRRVVPIQGKNLPFSAKMTKDGKIQLNIPKHIFGSAVPSRWLIAYPGIGLWDPSKLNTKIAYTYSHQFGSPNTLYPSTQEIRKPILNPTDSVTVYKFSMSAAYGAYLYNVFQETDFKNIFSTVPGSIYGNVTNNAQGYFNCTDVDVKRYLARDLVK